MGSAMGSKAAAWWKRVVRGATDDVTSSTRLGLVLQQVLEPGGRCYCCPGVQLAQLSRCQCHPQDQLPTCTPRTQHRRHQARLLSKLVYF